MTRHHGIMAAVLFAVPAALILLTCTEPTVLPVNNNNGEEPDPCTVPWSVYVADTVIVRTILDANQQYTIGVEEVTDVDTCGRIAFLDISEMDIRTLPVQLCSLSALTRLSLYNNALTQLPENIGRLRKLRELKVQNNKLTSIPSSIGDLDSLELLYLHENKLKKLPDVFDGLVSLRTLELVNNELDSIPKTLLKNNHLTVSIANNSLCAVNKKTEDWLNLSVVDVSDWKASQSCGWWTRDTATLGATVRALDLDVSDYGTKARVNGGRITGLDLSDQGITTLPDTLSALIGLEWLDLSGNDITTLPTRFSGLQGLQHLDLSNNNFESVPPELVTIEGLRVLDLSGNALASVDAGLFSLALSQLKLAHNEITFLPESLDSASIDTLIISDNLLCPDSLTGTITDWLDIHAGDWNATQTGCPTDNTVPSQEN